MTPASGFWLPRYGCRCSTWWQTACDAADRAYKRGGHTLPGPGGRPGWPRWRWPCVVMPRRSQNPRPGLLVITKRVLVNSAGGSSVIFHVAHALFMDTGILHLSDRSCHDNKSQRADPFSPRIHSEARQGKACALFYGFWEKWGNARTDRIGPKGKNTGKKGGALREFWPGTPLLPCQFSHCVVTAS